MLLITIFYFTVIKLTLGSVKFSAPDGKSYNGYGTSVSMDEEYIVVGSPQDDDDGSNSGSAYVYSLISGQYSFTCKLVEKTGQDASYGESVSVNSRRIAVGSPNTYESGYVYIYSSDGAQWSFESRLAPTSVNIFYKFGNAVSIYNDIIAVGSSGDDAPLSESGSAYVYQNQGRGQWSLQSYLVAPDATSSLYFGRSISVSGSVLAIGSNGYSSHNGAVFVYVQSSSSNHWSFRSVLFASGTSENFGNSISIQGTSLAIGSYDAFQNEVSGIKSGVVYYFSNDGANLGSWSLHTKLIPEDGKSNDWFGDSIVLDQNVIVVGAPQDDDNGSLSGSTYVYHRLEYATPWSLFGIVRAPDAATQDFFGSSVAAYGGSFVVGSPNDDDKGLQSGSIYIFNSTSLPTVSPTLYPTTTPTLVPSRLPSIMPSSCPSRKPTLSPTNIPTKSYAPTSSLSITIQFSVFQIVQEINSEIFHDSGYLMNKNKFEHAVAISLDHCDDNNINVVSYMDVIPTTILKDSLNRFLASGDALLIGYNVTVAIDDESEWSTADEAYAVVVSEIEAANVGGVTSILTANLQRQGPPFANSSVPDESPVMTPYSYVTFHSPSPSNTPTQSPSCGAGYFGSPCSPCDRGYYLPLDGDTCVECDQGYFTDDFGSVACKGCNWPFTTIEKGQSHCNAFQLRLDTFILIIIISFIMVVFLVSVYMSVPKHRILTCLVMALPLLDVVTDLLYILETRFFHISLFIACVIFFIVTPCLVFISVLVDIGAYPNFPGIVAFRLLLWLGFDGGYPSYKGKAVVLAFKKHDSIFKLLYMAGIWMVCIAIQCLCLFPAFCILALQSPFILIWLLLGTFLFQIKVLSLGKVWNIWFGLWTGNNPRYVSNVYLDVRFFNKSLLSEFLIESLPQVIIQSYNNSKTNTWSIYGYASAALSAIVALDGIWRFIYYRLYSGISFANIPISIARFSLTFDDPENAHHAEKMSIFRAAESIRVEENDDNERSHPSIDMVASIANPLGYDGQIAVAERVNSVFVSVENVETVESFIDKPSIV